MTILRLRNHQLACMRLGIGNTVVLQARCQAKAHSRRRTYPLLCAGLLARGADQPIARPGPQLRHVVRPAQFSGAVATLLFATQPGPRRGWPPPSTSPESHSQSAVGPRPPATAAGSDPRIAGAAAVSVKIPNPTRTPKGAGPHHQWEGRSPRYRPPVDSNSVPVSVAHSR